jgi:ABC transporter substrate binding protein
MTARPAIAPANILSPTERMALAECGNTGRLYKQNGVWRGSSVGAQTSLPLLGILQPGQGSPPRSRAAMLAGLAEHGFLEGQSVTLEHRFANGKLDLLPALALDLVRAGVAAIIALGTANTAQAAIAATSTIPIVFANGSDPS